MDDELQQRIFERVRDTLEEMHARAEALKGEHSLAADELFPPSFMQEHTSFERIEDFLVDGDFDVEREGDWEALADEGLDQHVRDTTAFDTWADMKDAAVQAWALDQLKS